MWTAFIAGGLLAAAAFGAYPRAQAWLERDWGILVGGQVPPLGGDLEAWLTQRERAIAARRVTLATEGWAEEVTFGELGVSLDVPSTARAARLAVQRSDLLSELRRRIAPSPELYDVPLMFHFDAARAGERLAALANSVHRDPVDARLDLAAHVRIADVPGRELDLAASVLQVAEGEREDGAQIPIVTRAIAPQITGDTMLDVDVSRVLSSFETDFTHHAGPRAINIATAARYLNGSVIGAGETFSFNRSVGSRTVERGFTEAPQIVADELEPGVGGGVCQVASTLYAAAVYGGLETVQRRSHSRPSGYTPLGLDATVIDGELDLKLRNPYDSALIVHAFLPTKTTLRIELLGRDAPGKVEHFYQVKEKHEFVRRVVVEPGFERNQSKRHQKGIWGYDVVSTVRTTYPNGQRSFRSYTSTYYPVPEVYWVGAGTDPSTLPPLPEGATSIEFSSADKAPPG
ncbi:MAG TPA: VanW family protein [Polyangiaceae bacterium]|nr:VanW family protein [Polyangiaceae bacterium]